MANKIPSISKAKFGDSGQQRNVDTMANAVDTLAGRKGNGLDRAVLVRDLYNMGIAKATQGVQGKTIPAYTPPVTEQKNLADTPESPSTTYTAGIDAIFITWDEPIFQGFLYAEIYRGINSNLNDAVLLDRTTGITYVDNVGWGNTPSAGGYYYWVRFVNTNGERGVIDTPKPKQNRHIAPTRNPADIINQATGLITKSTLNQALTATINDAEKIPNLYTIKVGGTDSNGNKLIGGFGLALDDNTKTIDAGFVADKFWVSGVGKGRAKPFIIDTKTNQVMISNAVINTASIDHAVTNTLVANKINGQSITGVTMNGGEIIGGAFYAPTKANPNFKVTSQGNVTANNLTAVGTMRSANYVANHAGWKIDRNGNVDFNNGHFRGDITGASGTFTGTVYADKFVGDVVSTKLFHIPSLGNSNQSRRVRVAAFTVTNRNSKTATLAVGSVPLFTYANTFHGGGNGSSHAAASIVWEIIDSTNNHVLSRDTCTSSASSTTSGGSTDSTGASTASMMTTQLTIAIGAGKHRSIHVDMVLTGSQSDSTTGNGSHIYVKANNLQAIFYRDGNAFS